MRDFELSFPTAIYFGKDSLQKLKKIVDAYDAKRIMIIYGQRSAERSGLIGRIKEYLAEYSLLVVNGVEPNPKLSLVKTFLKQAKTHQTELILAVGGGSVIDTAKLISAAIYYDGDPWDFHVKIASPKKVLPLGVVLTISAAGSEMSDSCVISNDEVIPFEKKGFNHPLNRPLFAILNPEYTFTLLNYQIACGTVDSLMHTLERYFGDAEPCELTDRFSEGLMKNILAHAKVAMENPSDYEAMSELMLSSTFSHNGMTAMGKKVLMRVHQLEHALSGLYDHVAHGAGLAILWPAWSKFALPIFTERFAQFSYEVLGLERSLSKLEAAQQGIILLEQFFKELGMPTRLSDVGVKEEDYAILADIATKRNTFIIEDVIPIDYEVALKIFHLAGKYE